MSDNILDCFLNLPNLSKQARRHPRTIVRWTRQPDGLPYVQLGREKIFHNETTRDWIMSRMRKPNPERRRGRAR